jgi:hypothetical protein
VVDHESLIAYLSLIFSGKACMHGVSFSLRTFGSDSGGVVSLLLRLYLYKAWFWFGGGNERRPGVGLAWVGYTRLFFGLVLRNSSRSIDMCVSRMQWCLHRNGDGRIYLLFFARSILNLGLGRDTF